METKVLSFRGSSIPVLFETPRLEERWESIQKATPFLDWLRKMEESDMSLHHVTIQSVDMFGPRVGFLKFIADVRRQDGSQAPGIVFMRGGAVVILVILQCGEKQFTLLTEQARVPIADEKFLECPAGMLDHSGHFAGIAAKEMEEETGIRIEESDLIDMTALAYGGMSGNPYIESNQEALVFPSPGGCDEGYRIFVFRKEVAAEELSAIEGRIHGEAGEHELIRLRVVPLEDAWCATRSAACHCALSLYENLVRCGKLSWS